MKNVIDALTSQRYFVSDDFIAKDLAYALLDEATRDYQVGGFKEASIGRERGKRQDQSIRGDSTLWWSENPESEAKQAYLALMQKMMEVLNPVFYLGLRSFEVHYARYDVGAFYKKHIDQHRGVGARRLTTILYLTDFEEGDGGELVLYDHRNPDKVLARVLPKLARLVLFLSEDFPHEVLPTHKPRLSVSGWLRAQ